MGRGPADWATLGLAVIYQPHLCAIALTAARHRSADLSSGFVLADAFDHWQSMPSVCWALFSYHFAVELTGYI